MTLLRLAFLIALAAPLALAAGCSHQPALPEACAQKPESGRCRASITRYYFDDRVGECRAFIWGGCDGVAPFETLEDCNAQCRPGAAPAAADAPAEPVRAPAAAAP